MNSLHRLGETVSLHELTVIRQCQKLVQLWLAETWHIRKAGDARYVATALRWEADRLENFANSLEKSHACDCAAPSTPVDSN